MGRTGKRTVRQFLTLLAIVVVTLALAAPAHSAFPGANGKIAFQDGTDGTLYTVNPDGSALTSVGHGSYPRWRPDGQKIAFLNGGAFLMNPDGTGVQPLSTTNPDAWVSSWSPDGQKITYPVPRGDPIQGCYYLVYFEYDIAVANADGTGQTFITGANGVLDFSPVWSPDGTKIAFLRGYPVYVPPGEDGEGDCWVVRGSEFFVMNADGTGVTDLGTSGERPDWSPDGQRLSFTPPSGAGVIVMNADGSNLKDLGLKNGRDPVWSPDGARLAWANYFHTYGIFNYIIGGTSVLNVHIDHDATPDWQPLPVPDYPHPGSASQLQTALVPVFRQCATGGNPANSKHTPSLAVDSCNPPRPGSAVAAVGPASQSSATFTTFPGDTDPTNGNQATFGITVNMTDIQATSGGDYDPNPTGSDMTAVTRLRITDKANGYGGYPATATEYDLRVPIACSPTADPGTGSTCTASTTANALYSRFIVEQRQTIVQAFRVRVDDAGPNGTPGDSDDHIFATQGVFVP